MQLMKNYKNDLSKSRKTSLLMELSKKDLDLLCIGEACGVNISLILAKELYDRPLKDINKTNLIFIDGDKVKDSQYIYLLDELLNLLEDNMQSIKNIKIVKESISSLASFSSAGILNDLTDTIIDNTIDFLADKTIGEIQDIFLDKTLKQIDSNIVDKIRKSKLYLSNKSKETIEELAQQFKNEMTPAESFRFVIQLLLSTTIETPKLLYIKNPHKLDKNSLAILSLLLSISKDKNKYTGLSIIYAYEDENLQPYMKVDEKYSMSKQLLDEQRIFAQRYAMLERPTSNIPNIAVKSWMFVGRIQELEKLEARYSYSKEHKGITTLVTISGEPGVGKTKLVKKHLQQIKKKETNGAKLIQLSLLNQIGHTSTNTGLSSLTHSIVNEAKRLEVLQKLTKLKNYIFEFVVDKITVTLGIDAIVNISQTASDGIFLDGRKDRAKLNTVGNLDNKPHDKKQEQFRKLTSAIKELQKLSDESMPIVLFIDDLQWIDEDSSEYLLQHFIKQFNVHMISTIRPSDATTSLKKAYDDKKLNPYKVSLLKKVHIKLYDDEKNEIEIASNINTDDIESYKTHLLGLNTETLKSLISKVIKGSETYQETLAKSIIEKFEDSNAKGAANTLFAIETINMLCDEKLYNSQNNKEIKKLILTDKSIRFNTKITNFKEALENTFKILDEKYRVAFEHINAEQEDGEEFKQKFNLMAYAVLEERLNILKIYFAEHGNAAVNTLLFSSLLGTPFNSNIVKNVLEAISTTDEELLQHLKEYILDGKDKVSLTETHYEIIEEVYEILSRYTAFENSYEYRHALLKVFLEKQLDYQLNKVFTINKTESKDKLYELILEEIKEEEKSQNFYKKNEQGLTSKEYKNMIYFKQIVLSLLKIGLIHNRHEWIEGYATNLLILSRYFKNQKNINEAIKVLKKVEYLLKDEKTEDFLEISMNCMHHLSNCYNENNQPEYGRIYDEDIAETMRELYNNNEKKWAEKYLITLNNLDDTHRNIFNSNKRLLDEMTEIVEKYEDIISDAYIAKYFYNFALYFIDKKDFKNTLKNAKKSYRIILKLDREKYIRQYVESVKLLSIIYTFLNYNEKAESYVNKNRKELVRLYSNNEELWVDEYLENLLSLAMYNTNSIDLLKKGLKIIDKNYEKQPLYWEEWKSQFKLLLEETKQKKNSVRLEEVLAIAKELAIQSNQIEIQREQVELAFSLINLNETGKVVFNFFPKTEFEISNRYNVENLLNSAKTYKKMDASIDILPSLYQLTVLFQEKVIGTIK